MRVVVTGGAGFIGRALVKKLATGGVDVVALVRDPDRASYLQGPRVSLVGSDLTDVARLTAQMTGADGVIHAAGSYRIGITPAERPGMLDANLGTTERVLDAAIAANARRIVYVSTVGVFGNTHGKLADETYRRDPTTKQGRYVSFYDESKYLAHLAAQERIQKGAPIVIVQPSQVYGPNDHSTTSEQLDLAFHGKLPYVALGNTGVCWVHVDDLIEGIVAALIRGRVGEAYVLAGPPTRLREAIAIAARAGGHKLPRLSFPTAALRLIAFAQRRGLHIANAPANLAETIRAGNNVTYWASAAKATKQLGFHARPLEQGVKDTWGGTARID
jgi:nucleoside-diphosphate-sugar epimerase